MIDIGLLECLSLDVILPESNTVATIIGRFVKERPNPADIPDKYKVYRILSGKGKKPSQEWTPPERRREKPSYIPAVLNGSEKAHGKKHGTTYGWLLTRNELGPESFDIVDWSFYFA